MATDSLIVRGAREHNLQNVSVEIPRNTLPVITGLSGSGKSSLAFDTIYEYDANNNLVKKLAEHSSAGGDGYTEFRFNHEHPLNYLIDSSKETTAGIFAVTKFQYDANGNKTGETLPEGNEIGYEYDSRDLNTKVTRGVGSEFEATARPTPKLGNQYGCSDRSRDR